MELYAVIDPGHYSGYNPWILPGHNEGDEMFTLAVMLKEELEQLGIGAKLTKQSAGENPGLYERGQMAVRERKNHETVVFLSLHDNAPGASAADPSSVRGTMIFTSMYRVNTTRDFLEGLQNAVAEAIGCGKREIYAKPYQEVNPAQDWWGVIRGAMDGAENQEEADLRGAAYAAIVEHDFHTNPEYCQWMADDRNKRRVARAEARYLADYFGMGEGQSSYQICNGTLRVVYGGKDGVNLHTAPDFLPDSVIGVLYYNDLRRAVGIISKANGDVLYRLEDGPYITAHGTYVDYSTNEYRSYTAAVQLSEGTLNVRDFPSDSADGGKILTVLGNENLVDVIGEAYHYGEKWLMIRVKRASGDITGFAAAQYFITR